MERDLRDNIKIFGRRIGLPIETVKNYAK